MVGKEKLETLILDTKQPLQKPVDAINSSFLFVRKGEFWDCANEFETDSARSVFAMKWIMLFICTCWLYNRFEVSEDSEWNRLLKLYILEF